MMPTSLPTEYLHDGQRKVAVVLGGGRSTRMGYDKLTAELQGVPLLRRTVMAAAAWADQVIVAGPKPSSWDDNNPASQVWFVVEEPPFGGPVAGIDAALRFAAEQDEDLTAALGAEVMLLAGDLANPHEVVTSLMEADVSSDVDGVCLLDEDAWAQYLAGIYRFPALRRLLEHARNERGDIRNMSVRKLLQPAVVSYVPAPMRTTMDIDTPEDLRRQRTASGDG